MSEEEKPGRRRPGWELTNQRNTLSKEQSELHKDSAANNPIFALAEQKGPRAQLEILGTLFDAEITLLPDGTIHVLDGHIFSRISPSGELEQVDLSESVGDGKERDFST